MKAFVTGAAGFIGSHLVEALLARGIAVRGADSFADFYPRAVKEANLAAVRRHASFEFHETNLLDASLAELLDGCDTVFHLAAQAGVRSSWGREFSTYVDANIRLTQRLLEESKGKRLSRFVYASSSSVYGDTPVLPMREDAPCFPVSPYGVTKLAAENLCQLYAKSYGLPAVSLRFFTVYGPRQRPDMAFSKFFTAARNGGEIEVFGDGGQTRDFTFVSDIVEGIIAAGEKGRTGAVYNLGGGSRVALFEVLEIIEEVTGARIMRASRPTARGDMRDTSADITAAKRDLGYSPKVSLKEGLARQWEQVSGLHSYTK